MFGIKTNLFRLCSNGLKITKNRRFINPIVTACNRFATFQASREYNPNEKIDFEVSKNPEEWEYVSRLIPLKTVPAPVLKESYPSGWAPQTSVSSTGPYFVRRSRNHMVPVYLKISHRGVRKITIVRHILGDIWLLASDLKKFIEEQIKEPIGYKVDEVGCKLLLRGDYVYYVEKFLKDKGF